MWTGVCCVEDKREEEEEEPHALLSWSSPHGHQGRKADVCDGRWAGHQTKAPISVLAAVTPFSLSARVVGT